MLGHRTRLRTGSCGSRLSSALRSSPARGGDSDLHLRRDEHRGCGTCGQWSEWRRRQRAPMGRHLGVRGSRRCRCGVRFPSSRSRGTGAPQRRGAGRPRQRQHDLARASRLLRRASLNALLVRGHLGLGTFLLTTRFGLSGSGARLGRDAAVRLTRGAARGRQLGRRSRLLLLGASRRGCRSRRGRRGRRRRSRWARGGLTSHVLLVSLLWRRHDDDERGEERVTRSSLGKEQESHTSADAQPDSYREGRRE